MKSESHPVMSNSLRPHGLYSPWNSTGQNAGVGSLSLLQGIFPTQVSQIAGGFFTSWAQGKHQNTRVRSLSLCQWFFPTQELNLGLLHCRWILLPTEVSGKLMNPILPYKCWNFNWFFVFVVVNLLELKYMYVCVYIYIYIYIYIYLPFEGCVFA